MGRLVPLGGLEAIAVSVGRQHGGVVHDAVDDGRGGGRIQEHLGPAGERQIRRDDEAPALVAAADEAEQEVGAGLVERHVAELVDDDHVEAGELVEFPGQPPLLLRFDEQRGQLGGRQEPDPIVVLAAGHAQGDGEMGLVGTAESGLMMHTSLCHWKSSTS